VCPRGIKERPAVFSLGVFERGCCGGVPATFRRERQCFFLIDGVFVFFCFVTRPRDRGAKRLVFFFAIFLSPGQAREVSIPVDVYKTEKDI